MKINIKKDSDNNPIGWDITGETEEEIKTVNTIRDLTFYGIGDTVVEYDGRTNGSKNNAGTLHWKQIKHMS